MIRRPTIPLQRLTQPAPDALGPTWRDARPGRIARALAAAQARDPGGWYVVGASTDVGSRSVVRGPAGREVALWRGPDAALHAGPGACSRTHTRTPSSRAGYSAQPRPPSRGSAMPCQRHSRSPPDVAQPSSRAPRCGQAPGEEPAEGPVLPARPPLADSIAAVVALPATCEPRDVIANRLDPWHGAWLHPYAFSHLVVDDAASTDDRLVLDVAFRLNRTWGITVRAAFTTPDARTIVMTILEGEGAGSVVETHATPLGCDAHGLPRTMVTEATIAYSARGGFAAARRLSRAIVPLVRRSARQLWADDLVYAERTYALRAGLPPG